MQHATLVNSTRAANRRFARHYAEMVAAMFLGMVLLGVPAGWLFAALGTSWDGLSPAMMLFAMTVTMSVPMAAWMRYRGHAWRPNIEMVASMFGPTFVLMALAGAHAVAGMAVLMVVEHVAMLACMFVAMLLRRDEYSCASHGHGGAARVAAA
jgi:hypothetical protein